MKHIINKFHILFSLSLFFLTHFTQYKRVKHYAFLSVSFFLLSNSAYAVTTYSCPGEDVLNINGTIISTSKSYTELDPASSTGTSKISRYFKFTTATNGSITITQNTEKNIGGYKNHRLRIGTSCNGGQIYNGGGTISDSHTFTVVSGTIYYIRMREANTKNRLNFTIDFVFTADNTPPTANAGADQSVFIGTSVTLSGSGTDSDGTITGYLWTEGATTLSNSASFTKSDFTVGTHTLTLTVTDDDGATATDTVFITIVPNSPPTANAGADQLINLGDNTSLDASGSSDSDGSIVAYLWQEGTITLSGNANFTLTGLTAGTHTMTLTVTDDKGDTGTDTVDIKVNTAPVANAGPDQNITLGDTLTLDGTGSTDDFNNITNYTWTESTIPLSLSGATTTANITTAGTYTITLTVTDDNGLTDTDTLTILVNTAPVVEDMNFTILRDTSVSFELTATDADGDTIVSYPIFSGPAHGSLSGPESNMTYTPDVGYTGVDTFTYKAYDGIDYSDEGIVTINVFPPATAVHDDFNTTYLTLLNGNVFTNDLGLNIHLIDFNTTANGLLNIGNDGAFTYLPNDLFDGNDTFAYTIKDDFNLTSTTTVNIVVYPPRSDLSISKTAPAQVDSGLPIDYTLTITNNTGEQYITAKNVRVTDYLPSGVIYSGVTAPSGWICNNSGGTVACDASNIPVGYSGTIIIHAFAPDILGDSINVATVGSDTIDSDLSNNTSSATTNITGPDVDLSITKTVSSPTAIITDAFSYTLSVQNSGTADTTGVTITDILDPSLGFISIADGTDWVCSQGSTINCSYIANGGIFVAGGSSNAITINVRAPSIEVNITNTASVNSNLLEIDTTNNNDSVDISIIDGTSQAGSVALSKYLQYNLYGDMRLIGNASVNYSGTDPNQNYNDNVNMRYVDTDSIASTFNSSSSTLVLADPSYNIIWVGLYWSGHVCSANNNGTGNGNGGGCDWSNSNFTSFNQATTNANLGSIQLKTPKRTSYTNIKANTLNIIQRSATDWTYSAFADITNLIDNDETGTYTVADIVLSEGQVSNGGNYGGWAMLVVYEDDNKTLQYKNISVFNGFQRITTDNNPLQISGFLTPLSGAVTASIAFFAGDGDPTPGGVARMRQGNTNTYSAIGSVAGNAASPTTNLFNSTVGEFGQAINTGVLKTYGVDADQIDVSSFMVNGQTDTEFRLDVATPTGGVDWYNISLFAFATDLTSPIIDNFSKSAVIIDTNGTRRVAGPNQAIYPGSSLEYTISFANTGDELAEDVVIFDDFDFDGLSQALDINHFDTSKLKLFTGNGTTNEIANPDCGYDISDRRVYCNLPIVQINESFTMQFVVTVKENLDISLIDKNATNTAYSRYRNPNGNNYVEFYTTPSGEPVGGKSNALNSGIFSAINRENLNFISIDAINALYNYANDKNITTKIVNKPFDIQLIHRDLNDDNTPYVAWSRNGNTRSMAVLVTLQGDGTPTPPLAVGTFYAGTRSTTVSGLTLDHAHRNDRFKMAYLDWRSILSKAPSTSACIINPAQSTNLSGVPACFNNYDFVDQDVFPRLSYMTIASCFGKGATPTPNGKTYPCNPRAYSTGGNLISANIYPDVYSHNYGCYQCIAEGSPRDFLNDSTDNFAARPDRFEFDSNNSSFPDLLRSGLDYNLSLRAIEYNSDSNIKNPTKDYNTTGNTFKETHVLNPNNNPAITVPLDEGNITIGSSGADIKDGISVDASGNPAFNIGIKFNNVGEVGVKIIDIAWAIIDEDDTPEDCNATQNENGIDIEAGRGICGNIDTRFIPHHFELNSTVYNHRSGSFTYLHTDDYTVPNDPHMAANVGISIAAKNADGDVTTNFKRGAYQNNISADLNITDWNTTLKAIKDALNPRLDVNSNKRGISNQTLNFGINGDANGTYNTTDINSSRPYAHRLLFNYDRTQNNPSDPFIINGSEVNTTITSTYTSTKADEGNATIKGDDIADGSATFYYARVRPARDFYPNVTAAQQNTPVLIDVYCDISVTMAFGMCNGFGIDTSSGFFGGNEYKWWLALKHDRALNDGNVTLKVNGTGGLNRTNVIIRSATNNAEDANIIVTPGTVNRPVTVRIDLKTDTKTETNEWIYDPTGIIPPPFEEVEFIGSSDWTGQGQTGNVVNSNASKKINKRLGW